MTASTSFQTRRAKPVLLDVDPGIDDTLAILLALQSPEIEVVGITVVAGNVAVDQGVENALKVLELAGHTDIPVARGAETPLFGKLVTAVHVHGQNGLGNIDLPKSTTQPYNGVAADLIAAKVEDYAGEITLVPVGPLTNIAMALRLRPDLVPKIKEIILMGGSASGGNITPAAEFNIFNDPEAAQIVFESGVPIVMVGLDVTMKTVLRKAYLSDVDRNANPVTRLVTALTDYSLGLQGSDGITLHDPLAVGVAIDPSFVEAKPYYVEVETRGEKTRGETVVNRRGIRLRFEDGPRLRTVVERQELEPNTKVCLEVDSDRFVKFFVDRVLR